MFVDQLTISPDNLSSVSTNLVTWNVIDASGKLRRRLNGATTISEPEHMVINHFVQGSESAGNLADRHLLQFSRVEKDAAGKAYTMTFNGTLLVPRTTLFTSAEARRLVNLAANFMMTSTNLDRFLTGES